MRNKSGWRRCCVLEVKPDEPLWERGLHHGREYVCGSPDSRRRISGQGLTALELQLRHEGHFLPLPSGLAVR